jgi:putative NADH-flavin reductase
MKLLVIGASHGIGLEIVKQGAAAGHRISAMSQDAVCITIGTKPTLKQVSVFSEGTANVIKAMKNHSCKVLLCITGIGAGDSRGHGGFLYDRIINPLLLGRMYADKDIQEEIVRSSGLEWLIVRPGFLTNGPRTGQYQVLSDMSGVRAKKISRADVADFILHEVVQRKYKSGTVLLTYR